MAGLNLLYNTEDIIEVNQGSSWVATFSIFDDLEFRQVVTDKLESLVDLSDKIKYPLIHLVNNTDLSRSDLQICASNLLSFAGVDDAVITGVSQVIMTHARTVSLAGKQISFYVKIYKGSREFKFQAQAVLIDEDNGLVKFNIPPEVTQSMVKTRRRDEIIDGIYTVEILDTYTNEIHRIAQGRVLVNRGAK